jgi:formamidopyrimidine-DNA glycosylase
LIFQCIDCLNIGSSLNKKQNLPELPEVETIRRQLEKAVVGKTIKMTEVLSAKKINVTVRALVTGTVGTKIVAVRRRAKLLLINLSNGHALAIHLKMTGRVLINNAQDAIAKHTFVIFGLSNGKQIRWEDYRRFGFLKLFSANELQSYLAAQKFGPEPLDKNFDVTAMTACFARRPHTKIKQLLMDPVCIAGIGNIYAAEALHFARIRPDRPAGKLTKKENIELWRGIRKVLLESIANRGTSADAYVDAMGEEGTNVKNLKVYDREGKPCLRHDGGVIKKTKLAGRGTYFCPVCQK